MQWIQNKIPTLSIQNFSTDWKNGTAIGALINAIAPGLCVDWNTWNITNYLKNTQEAMQLAKDWLDIQMFVTAEEVIAGKATEKCFLIYLCQFPMAKLRSGAPLRAKYISNRLVNRLDIFNAFWNNFNTFFSCIKNISLWAWDFTNWTDCLCTGQLYC